ncbi:MAG: hypothetical protein R3D33_00495 [Hyphomicrobiaceae bacterium]
MLDASGRGWLVQDLITLVSQPSLEGCLALLESGEVDAVVADEADRPGRQQAGLGIGEGVDMLADSVATRDLEGDRRQEQSARHGDRRGNRSRGRWRCARARRVRRRSSSASHAAVVGECDDSGRCGL